MRKLLLLALGIFLMADMTPRQRVAQALMAQADESPMALMEQAAQPGPPGAMAPPNKKRRMMTPDEWRNRGLQSGAPLPSPEEMERNEKNYQNNR